MYCGYLAGFSPSLTFRPPTDLSLSGSLSSAWGGPPGSQPAPGSLSGSTELAGNTGNAGGYTILLSALPAGDVASTLPHVPTEAEDELLRLVMNKAMAKLLDSLRRNIISDGQTNYVSLSDAQRIKESLLREVRYNYFWK